MQEISEALKVISQRLFGSDIEPELARPEEQFGDYSTNVAMQLAPKVSKSPRLVAEALATEAKNIPGIADATVAGPGFINLKLTDEKLAEMVQKSTNLPEPLAGQEIVLEHTDPNPFKEFHVGHAYSNTVGVSVGKILQAAGANVHQVTYQGDVGLHIAMAIYGLKQGQELFSAYAFGVKAASDNPQAKSEIEAINAELYNGQNEEVNRLYDDGRKRSLAEFEKIYHQLSAVFEKNYFESDTAGEGQEIVKRNIGKVFEESDGAVIYKGEKAGLHTRVFITSKGLPTYEAKEMGLAFAKNRDYPQAKEFIVITGNDIDDYFNVLVAAIKEVSPELGAKIRHSSHGIVRLPEGKMSSRTGKVKTFESLKSDLESKARELYGDEKDKPETVLGAMKYEFLKHRVGSDFIFDVDESISLQGNSGPYLQYAHARACGIIQKAGDIQAGQVSDFEPGERSLARKISEYPEVVAKATAELMPHYICTYLYELAQVFNRFYENNRVVDDPRQDSRLRLVKAYADVLKNGLGLLNIAAPEHI